MKNLRIFCFSLVTILSTHAYGENCLTLEQIGQHVETICGKYDIKTRHDSESYKGKGSIETAPISKKLIGNVEGEVDIAVKSEDGENVPHKELKSELSDIRDCKQKMSVELMSRMCAS